MARFVANQPFDMVRFFSESSLSEFFEFGDVLTHTSSTFVVREDYAGGFDTLTLTGSFTSYEDVYPSAGTVTGGSFARNGVTMFTFSGASIPVSAGADYSFRWFVDLDDMEGLFRFMLRGNDELVGSSGDDALAGFDGNDDIDGGLGGDWMFGGIGNDTYHVDTNDDVVAEAANEGTDTIVVSGLTTYAIGWQHVENLTYSGTADFRAMGTGEANVIRTGSGNDTVQGMLGTDTMIGGAGNDRYYADDTTDIMVEKVGEGLDSVWSYVDFVLPDEVEYLFLFGASALRGEGNELNNVINGNLYANSLYGGAGNDSFSGGEGADTIEGEEGNDAIDGGAGNDLMAGGSGNDRFIVDSTDDIIIEDPDEGTDLIMSSAIDLDLELEENVENLALLGTANLNGSGDEFSNVLYGNDGKNELDGGAGDDTINAGLGDDVLIGGAGVDQLNGGEGNDTASYEDAVGPEGVIANLATGQSSGNGGDSLISIENLIGSDFSDRLTGDAASNILFGALGGDLLNGGAGDDVLDGHEGDDVYVISSPDDHLKWEIDDTGSESDVDEVRFSAAGPATLTLFTGDTGIERIVIGTGTGATAVTTGVGMLNVDASLLANGVEIIGNSGMNTLEGTLFEDTISAGNGIDRLYGSEGNDTLDGGRGADVMYGGFDDDLYIVDDLSDAPIETADGGIDVVLASVAHTLKANVENLTQAGNYSIHASGNSLNNQMVGNSGSNRLWGLAGDDVLIGGAGNDTLDGGTGADDLVGQLGNDIYVIDNPADTIVEFAAEGNDTVRASVSWALGDHVEVLELTGTAALVGDGNGLANTLKGNSGANTFSAFGGNDKIYAGAGADLLDGGEGGDWLEGGAGRDELTGGLGSDRFVFRTGDMGGATTATADVIHDFVRAQGDKIRLDLIDANTSVDGVQDFAFIGSGAFTNSAGQLRYEQIGGNTFVSGDTNGDGVADFMIQVDGLQTFKSSDFIL